MFLINRWILVAALAVTLGTLAGAQETPRVAGADGVPVPKRTSLVKPEYPLQAAAEGLRGIVILELVIGPDGSVSDVVVIRSVPPFDEAAIAAARQWKYEPTVVDGEPVSVRLTVPITFLMKLPEVTRQEGIPELRSGAVPPFPAQTDDPTLVTAFVTLAPDGQVAEAEILEGDSPWTESLISALRTWRFDARALESGKQFSFRVEAHYRPKGGGAEDRVEIELLGLQTTSDAMISSMDFESGTPADAHDAGDDATAEEGADSATPSGTEGEPDPTAVPGAASEAADGASTETVASEVETIPESDDALPATEAPAPTSEERVETAEEVPPETVEEREEAPTGEDMVDDPKTEVLTSAVVPDEPLGPVEPGISSVRGIFLEPGVPDLARGRQPITPPFARIEGQDGDVTVRFAVDASGEAIVNAAEGPELFRLAARTTVESWFFPRQNARRLYMVAVFEYRGTQATATVSPDTAR